jgi:DNA-binding MarR family transcriptional regulator
MDTGTITPLVKRLEQAGFFTRCRDIAHQRRVFVDLTNSGEAMREQIWAVPDQMKTACRVSDENSDELSETLDGVSHIGDG